ncbi:MAG TPA: hypothetical protein VGS19_01190 [Streptosporangiaceae bacterium]|nr:hypothetical protein [Streptosporangiaceae bacterium]
MSTGRLVDSIREEASIEPTSRDKGLALTVTVTAYDNGFLMFGGKDKQRPIREEDGWLGVAERVVLTLRELQRQSASRQGKDAAMDGG